MTNYISELKNDNYNSVQINLIELAIESVDYQKFDKYSYEQYHEVLKKFFSHLDNNIICKIEENEEFNKMSKNFHDTYNLYFLEDYFYSLNIDKSLIYTAIDDLAVYQLNSTVKNEFNIKIDYEQIKHVLKYFLTYVSLFSKNKSFCYSLNEAKLELISLQSHILTRNVYEIDIEDISSNINEILIANKDIILEFIHMYIDDKATLKDNLYYSSK